MTYADTSARLHVLRNLRLLLIDDNPYDRDLLARALSLHFGSTSIVLARDADEFERTMTSGDFDAAIVDYQLQWTTGIEVLRRIKRSRPDCPVLMFTASGSEEVAVEAMKEGLDDYITKTPKHYGRLPFALEACLERMHQAHELAEARTDRARLAAQVSAVRHRLQFALESAGMVAWELDFTTNDLHLSSNAETLLGVRWTTLHQAMAAVNAADLSKARVAYEAAVEASAPFFCELRVTNPRTQRELWLEIRGQAIRGKAGAVVRLLGVAVDISDRMTAEHAQAHLAAIVRSSDDAIIGMTPDGIVTSWNEGATRLLGYSAAEMLGHPIMQLVPLEQHEAERTVLTRIASGEHVPEFEAVRIIKSQARISVSVRHSRVADRAGSMIGISSIVRDISERKRAEEALRLADRRKDAFLATLAHELRNPLAPIRYATRLLEPGVPAQMAADAKKMIDRQLAHMSRLLDDLLDVSRITRGVLEIRREALDLRDIIGGAVGPVRPIAEAAGQQLAVHLPPEPLVVHGDAVRLIQIFGNLLHNATKYTAAAGHITITAASAAEEVVVRIQDDGVGIAPEALEGIFEPFVQLNPVGTRAADGLGLGLSLAKDLVKLHGGRIEAHSAGPGCGSEFVVRLPRAGEKPAITEAVAAADKVIALGAVGVGVLVVDDNVDAATSLSYVLSVAGYQATVVHDGEEALAKAEELRPAIVLLDIGLPGMSGHEVARRLRSEPWGKDMQLIAITGWGQESDRRKSLEAGFDEHLTKPIDPELLLRRIIRAARSVAQSS